MTRYFVAAVLALILLPAAAPAASIDAARSAYMAYEVPKAEALYRAVADDPAASPKERGTAEVELARIAWLVDDRGADAAASLARSLVVNPEPCAGAFLYGRVLNAIGRMRDVPLLVGPYVARCVALEPGVATEVTRSWILTAAALPPARRGAALAEARRSLAALPPLARAGFDAARAALDIGLLAGDGSAALAGWRDYLWLGTGSKPQGFAASEAAITAAFVDGARGNAPARASLALAELLVRAGFAEEAERLAAQHRLARSHDPRWPKVAAYLAMRARLQSVILAHDRAYARSRHEDGDAFEKTITGILRDGVQAAGETVGDDPWPKLQALWGLHGQTGTINGVSGLMAGHAVEDRQQTVTQGTRHGAIRYLALDNMIADSFSAWLWDRNIGPAGWASGGALIYQVRPLYGRGTLRMLAVALGGAARDKALADSATATARDAARLRGDDPVPLPGLAGRLTLQAIAAVTAEALVKAPDEAGFIAAFRRAWWDHEIQSSIILHEGRHVLDEIGYAGARELSAPELEYRGKLSEIGYSDLPRNALSGILGAELARDTSHGAANARIMALYRDWVAAHAAEVAGIDPAQPAALQIDRLSDDQIRAIAHGADPELHQPPPAGAR
ncbi:MAG: hypothetical protein JWM65_741 [Sphingomonas bacterium]|nr:hypothetical protein [Sphingomonas bacterium]